MIINGYKIGRGADLKGANLQDADLQDANLQGTNLQDADLQGANLQDADLRYANLQDADLRGADLRGADLHGAKLWGAKLDYIPGSQELLKKVAEHALAKEDSLEMCDWHTCDTTHCIAGWATHLHPEGRDLEDKYGTEVAGLLLLGSEAHSHFFDSNVDAIEYLESILS